MLSKRKRYIVFFLVVGLILISGGLTGLFTVLDINPKSPSFFEDNHYVVYRTGGSYASKTDSKISIDITSLSSEKTIVKAGNTTLETTPEGHYIFDNEPTDNYTLFWIFLKNPVLHGPGSSEGRTYWVIDPIGIISEENEAYKLVIEESTILWSNVYSSQAAVKASIYKENVKVASGVYDATCGMLFRLETHENGYSSLNLESTNFPISRNRNYNLALAIVVIFAVIIGVYFWYREVEPNKNDERNLVLNLLATGFACVLVDLYFDVWFFETITSAGLIAIHLLLGALLYYMIDRWAIPAFLEIGFVLAFSFTYLNGSIVPTIAYFPGLLVTWIIMYLLVTRREQVI